MAATPWRSWQKIIFRFFFILLGSSTLFCWIMVLYFAGFFDGKSFNITSPFKFFVKPFYWLDRHLYYTGYDPKIHDAFPQDDHYGVVFYLTLALIAITGTMIWSVLDRRRPQYERLLYWFRLYLRYVLALVMFGYGIAKFIPAQMPYPSVADLLTPMSEQTRFTVLWNFMGVAPGYMILTGASEIIGSLLVLNRRTVVLGYLLQLGILINVVAFNIFYNVPVKMFSTQLLTYVVFLLVPYFPILFRLFFLGQPAALAAEPYRFGTPWKKYILVASMIVIPVLLFSFVGHTIYGSYQKQKANAKLEKIYDVVSFVAKSAAGTPTNKTDTVAPLMTDTVRWKRLLLAYGSYAIIYNMQDGKDTYDCRIDSFKKTFTLNNSPDSLQRHVFHYTYPVKDQLLLTGRWKEREVTILLRSLPLDSFPINKEKIKWVLD